MVPNRIQFLYSLGFINLAYLDNNPDGNMFNWISELNKLVELDSIRHVSNSHHLMFVRS